MMRIGILGGTFDPIHLGHLLIAEESRITLGLERVLFVPAGRPWLKEGQPLTDAVHRVRMVELATASNPHFQVRRNEVERPGPSYTVDTLGELRAELDPDAELYFILGLDALESFHRWKEPERVLDLCRLVVVGRPGYSEGEREQLLARYQGPPGPDLPAGDAQCGLQRHGDSPPGRRRLVLPLPGYRGGGGIYSGAWVV